MNIVILGSGNVASHIGKGFQALGYNIVQVYSRKQANALALASILNAQATDQVAHLHPDADLYLIAVADQAIAAVAEQMPKPSKGIVVHCSGATDMKVLARFEKYGVLYPVQSLRKDMPTDLRSIPFGIEGSQKSVTDHLMCLMQHLSSACFLCNSEQRLTLHISAVFVNNFSNALFGIAYRMLEEQNLPFDLLKPIISATAQKVQEQRPQDVQTGPAARGDLETLKKHSQFLSKNPDWLDIYQQITEEIIKNRN